MREILFRGKSNWTYRNVKKGDWLYGMTISRHCYNDEEITSYYIGGGNNSIDGKTLGQYTGLTDKNDKKIFEGDIVRHTQLYELSGNVESIGFVKWSESYGAWIISSYTNGRADMFLGNERHRIEIIGNIHDNPELLNN